MFTPSFRLGGLGGSWGHPRDGQPKKSSVESGCTLGCGCWRNMQLERSG